MTAATRVAFDTAWSLAENAVATERIPCAVLGVLDPNCGRQVAWAGLAQKVPTTVAVSRDTVFDLASLTKPIFTTERILAHASAGRIDLDAPLISVIPDFRQYDVTCWERSVTFRECLGHCTHFPAVVPLYTQGNDPATLRAFVLQNEWKQVAKPVYSDINFILLGIALERLEGCPIRNMDASPGFSFTPESTACAATEACTWRGRMLRGEVHDENCFALQGSGHAGLFGTADALLDFGKYMLDRGAGLANTPLSKTHSHGWEISHSGWSGGQQCSPNSIGHTGFTGTGLWIDFEVNRVWTLLTNRVHPTRHNNSGIHSLRTSVAEALYGA